MSEKETQAIILENQENNLKKSKKKLSKKAIAIISIILVVVIVVGYFGINIGLKPDNETEIITTANLKQIIEVSELSTYECVYNGIAVINNEEKPDKIDYYVAYNAKVKAGIDFEAVVININQETKVITVEIPQVKIHSINVDMGSMDFIFVNKKAEASGVTEQAFKQCENDVKEETEVTDAIYELAKKNAENIIKALLTPFINQLDAEYTVEIK